MKQLYDEMPLLDSNYTKVQHSNLQKYKKDETKYSFNIKIYSQNVIFLSTITSFVNFNFSFFFINKKKGGQHRTPFALMPPPHSGILNLEDMLDQLRITNYELRFYKVEGRR
ncbi:MAG TPA: hypothetical protein PK471_00105 [Bacteroidales bacterium]|nr:hypothetical protein [Bacteroidales bacterium]